LSVNPVYILRHNVGNPGPGLGQTQKCGGVKLVSGISSLSLSLDNWISGNNTDINK